MVLQGQRVLAYKRLSEDRRALLRTLVNLAQSRCSIDICGRNTDKLVINIIPVFIKRMERMEGTCTDLRTPHNFCDFKVCQYSYLLFWLILLFKGDALQVIQDFFLLLFQNNKKISPLSLDLQIAINTSKLKNYAFSPISSRRIYLVLELVFGNH